jgi:hypothetical protein
MIRSRPTTLLGIAVVVGLLVALMPVAPSLASRVTHSPSPRAPA